MRHFLSLLQFMGRGLPTYLLAISIIAGVARSYSGGPPDGYAGDPPSNFNCTACHASFPVNSGGGTLQMLNLPAEYRPDSTYTLSLSLEDNGQRRWGFELTVILDNGLQGGGLAPSNPSYVQISPGPDSLRDYAKQTTAGTLAGQGSAAWDLLWTAPPVGSGSATFYVAGNAANNNGSTSGDYIYTISANLPEGIVGVVEAPSHQPESQILLSAYPNPFNPLITLILRNVPAGEVKIELYNSAGRILRRMQMTSLNGGPIVMPLNLEDLPSGRYLVRAAYPGGTATQPLIKLK